MEKKFHCSQTALKVLKKWNILWENETPEEMIQRVCSTIKEVEINHFDTKDTTVDSFITQLEDLLYNKKMVPSTPIMTNLWRLSDYPSSACIVPSLDLTDTKESIKQKVDQLHLEWMGTGFNFTGVHNSLELICFLNTIAKELQESWLQNRPVGNMGIMSIYDPSILQFIHLKHTGIQQWIDWKFNFSVDIDDVFMEYIREDKSIALLDGSTISARYLFHEIAKYTYLSWDPGIVRLDQMNKTNPLAHIAPYTATAPCWEVWLALWETCQFSSINLAQYVTSDWDVDYDWIQESIDLIVRFLDDCLEYSIHNYSDTTAKSITQLKRKIGVGVCWFGDMLIKLWVSYWSFQSIQLARDLMSFINYHSKLSSIGLAQERWSFGGIKESNIKHTHYFSSQYAHKWSQTITSTQREELDRLVDRRWIRNASTTALPPTGRSSIVFDTSQQIEPIFNLMDYDGNVRSDLMECLQWDNESISLIKETGTCSILSDHLSSIYKTSIEIDPQKHLNILLAFQDYTDESVSKTINMPHDCTVEEIEQTYLHALQSGVKWITIYRDGSRDNQPVALSA